MKLSIYLEDYLIDTDSSTNVALTLSYSYIEDPTLIAGDYSKTISVPGTNNNNKIFGHIWKLDRVISFSNDSSNNSGVLFNASKRTPAKIYLGNSLFKSGYVQLNKIKTTSGKITGYDMTFYSELCNVIHKLMDSSLSNLKFPGNLTHNLTLDNIHSNIQMNGPSILGADDKLSDYVKYCYTNDGQYDSFDSAKWLTYSDSSHAFEVTDIDGNGANYDSAMLLQASCTRLRPFIKINKLLEQIQKDFNEDSSVKLNYQDAGFFNTSNPYVNDSLLSLKTYDNDNASVNNVSLNLENAEFKSNFSTIGSFRIILDQTGVNTPYVTDDGNLDLSQFSNIPNLEINSMIAISGTLDKDKLTQAMRTAVYHSGVFLSNPGTFSINLQLVNVDDSSKKYNLYFRTFYEGYAQSEFPCTTIKDSHSVAQSPIIYLNNTNEFEFQFTNSTYDYTDFRQGATGIEEVLVYQSNYTNLNTSGRIRDTRDNVTFIDDGIGTSDFFPVTASSGNITPGIYSLNLVISNVPTYFNVAESDFGDTSIQIPVTGYTIQMRSSTSINPTLKKNSNPEYCYRNSQRFGTFNANSFPDTRVDSVSGTPIVLTTSSGVYLGSVMSFSDMVNNDTTQADFLVNYCKLFNLVFDTDNTGTIDIKSRDSFHSGYKILDWSDKIDYSQSFEMNPLSFNSRYFNFGFNDPNTYYSKKYSDMYNVKYGAQTIDTGYEFNDTSTNLISNQMFVQNVPVKGEALLKNIPVPSFFDKSSGERSTIDGHYSLMFDSNVTQALTVMSSDEHMHNEDIGGSEQDCWMDVISLDKAYYTLNRFYDNVPVPQTLINKNDQIYSFDIGYPRANYSKLSTSDYPSSSTIYSQFWRNYLQDLYDVDCKVLTCYVKLSKLDMMNFTFKNFVRINDALFHPNQIIDYNPLSDAPVKVELIRVQNINAYLNSQNKWYLSFNADFNFTAATGEPIEEIVKPLSGGISLSKSGTNTYSGSYVLGSMFTQRFTYVKPFYSVESYSAYYFDSATGTNKDISSWFNPDTLSFTMKERVESNITLNCVCGKTTDVYHNVSYISDNATFYMEDGTDLPNQVKEGSSFTCKVKPTDSSYKLSGHTILMNNVDITSSSYSDDGTITIANVTGDIILNFSYADVQDILLPWIKNNLYSDSNVDVQIKATQRTNLNLTDLSSKMFDSFIIHGDNMYSGSIYKYLKSDNTVTASNNVLNISCTFDTGDSFRTRTFRNLTSGTPATNDSFRTRYEFTLMGTTTGALPYSDDETSSSEHYYEGQGAYDLMLERNSPNRGSLLDSTYRSLGTAVSPGYNPGSSIYIASLCIVPDNTVTTLGSYSYALFSPLDKVYSYKAMGHDSGDSFQAILCLHYFEGSGYELCYLNILNNTYVKVNNPAFNSRGDKVYSYDTTSKDDIDCLWIGTNGNCVFQTDLLHCSNKIGMQVTCSFRDLNTTTSGNTIIGYPGYVEDGLGNGEETSNSIMATSTGLKYEFGLLYNELSEKYRANSLSQQMTFSNHKIYTLGMKPSTVSSNLLRCYYDSDVQTTTEEFAIAGTNQFQIFDWDLSGVRIYKIKLADFNTSLRVNSSTMIVPCLHYLGGLSQYVSSEGISVPQGYVPCFKIVGTNDYIYPAGNPTFGFSN